MEGDASGGVVNLVMKTAPDNLKVDVEVGTWLLARYFSTGHSQVLTASTVNSKSPGKINPRRL